MKTFLYFFLRGEFGQKFWAGAEGRNLVQGRLRAAAVGRNFQKKVSSKEFFDISKWTFQNLLVKWHQNGLNLGKKEKNWSILKHFQIKYFSFSWIIIKKFPNSHAIDQFFCFSKILMMNRCQFRWQIALVNRSNGQKALIFSVPRTIIRVVIIKLLTPFIIISGKKVIFSTNHSSHSRIKVKVGF